MTSLEDRAAESPDVVLASEATGAYRLESLELAAADDVTPQGQFPEHGEFLETTALSRGGDDQGEAWVECPQDLAASLIEAEVEAGDEFVVASASKNRDHRWVFEVDPGLENGDSSQ